MTNPSFQITPEAVCYAWRELARRAGFLNPLKEMEREVRVENVRLMYGPADADAGGGPALIVAPCRPEAFARLVKQADHSLDCVDAEPFDEPLPVLFRGEGAAADKPFAEERNGRIYIYVDVIASVLFMLTRWEESVSAHRDEHGRFPATASVAFRQGFLDRPVIDQYALALREQLRRLLPGWVPDEKAYRVAPSHDIDWLHSCSGRLPAICHGLADLIKRRDPHGAREKWRLITRPEQDAVFRAIDDLARESERHGTTGAFNFMGARRSRLDLGHDPDVPHVRRCISDLQARGHEIGFHPGYHTLNNATLLAREKARVERAVGGPVTSGRQHYLRFDVPRTWRLWEEAGMKRDSTLGYADHEGFRCGTCHPFQPFDLERNRVLDIEEQPLVVSDTVLRHYRKLSPADGLARVIELARRCREVDGTFSILWHNTSCMGEWSAYYRDVYQAFLAR